VISIDDLERAAAQGWRATQTQRLGGWLLRAAEGFTGRANSALGVGDPGLPLPAAAARVTSWYRTRGLPAMIAVPYPAGRPAASELDCVLADLGWSVRAGAASVMTARAAQLRSLLPGSVPVRLDSRPDAAWLARYHYRGQQLPPVALELLTSAPWQAFASVRADGDAVAIGRVAVAGDWAGLTAIEVDPRYRRQGLAGTITTALTTAAVQRGAHAIYLQVADDNSAARALYGRLGFAEHHGYHYRVAPAD
jgi:N-acetylglutamate synthase